MISTAERSQKLAGGRRPPESESRRIRPWKGRRDRRVVAEEPSMLVAVGDVDHHDLKARTPRALDIKPLVSSCEFVERSLTRLFGRNAAAAEGDWQPGLVTSLEFQHVEATPCNGHQAERRQACPFVGPADGTPGSNF